MLTTLKQTYYLGVDGGATRTEAIIASSSGFVLGTGISGGCNTHNISVNVASEHIMEAINKAKESVYRRNHDILPEHIKFEAACLGIAGIDTEDDRLLVIDTLNNWPTERMFQCKKIIVVNDGVMGLRSAFDNNWGVCLISGTGCNCYGLTPQGKETFIGGWGYILGDQGSAHALGQAILQQVIKEYDGRTAPTILTELVLEHLHLENVSQLITWVYHDNNPVERVASLSKMVTHDVLMQSSELLTIVNRIADELLTNYTAVINRLRLDADSEIPVALVGWLFSLDSLLTNRVIHGIRYRTPNAVVRVMHKSSAHGAIKLAKLFSVKYSVFPESALIFENGKIR